MLETIWKSSHLFAPLGLLRYRKRHPPVGAGPGTLAIPEGAPAPRIRVLHYDAGDVLEQEDVQSEELAAFLDAPGTTWIDVEGIGDEGVMRALAEVLGLHALVTEDVVNTPQRPKAEPYDNHVLLIVRMVTPRPPAGIDSEQVSIVVGDRFVATFQERPGDVLDPVRARVRSGAGRIRTAGPGYLAYAILDSIIDAYYPVVEALGDALEMLEDEVMLDPSPDVLRKLNGVKNTLALLRRLLWPQRDAINSLIRGDADLIGEPVRVFLRDTHDHCTQLAEVVESYRELASGLLNTHLAVVSNRMNEIMKVLTIMASIFIPLGFLAGVYGMNFDDMPELHLPWGYPALLAVMASAAMGMLLYFWRRGWIGDAGGSGGRGGDGDGDAGRGA